MNMELNDHYNIIYKLDIENAVNEEENQLLNILSYVDSNVINDNVVEENIEFEEEMINYIDQYNRLNSQFMASYNQSREQYIVGNGRKIEFNDHINILMNDINEITTVVLDFLNRMDSEREIFLNVLALQLDDINTKLKVLKNGI